MDKLDEVYLCQIRCGQCLNPVRQISFPMPDHLPGQGKCTGREGSECTYGRGRISGAENAYQERTRLHTTVLKIRVRTEVASYTGKRIAHRPRVLDMEPCGFFSFFWNIGDHLEFADQNIHRHPSTKRVPSYSVSVLFVLFPYRKKVGSAGSARNVCWMAHASLHHGL